ncbi:hypothetical protein LTR56_018666 [Elasticomyces elasticus]|nr:hypothetical protein LTR56_018666 [Elasticomyces elasticus]KAK3642820.1 hypothetical protein LTR22_015878 [Elasticomyces elasticus]KAK4920694.1 hypothetical protein LTR49_011770 [Elasticomyces elasticus]KAK5754108.1 hypothetical protein LTS12_015750 [Elasticomyces elasticus]
MDITPKKRPGGRKKKVPGRPKKGAKYNVLYENLTASNTKIRELTTTVGKLEERIKELERKKDLTTWYDG